METMRNSQDPLESHNWDNLVIVHTGHTLDLLGLLRLWRDQLQ
jgi:hypothetical protein